jgi:hypothetical protein
VYGGFLRFRLPTGLWLSLTGVALLVGFVKAPPFPTIDPALFEYYGRQLLGGARLYVDFWDYKLPSIYLVNELWQWLFGDRYRFHVAVEVFVNALSIGLFAALLRRHKLPTWPWATFCFAAVLVLPPAAYDFTEFYALPLILGAFLAIDTPFVAGICLALALTFWIPAVLLGIVSCIQRARRDWLVLFAAGVLAVVIPYATVFVLVLGPNTMSALAATWPAYIKQGGTSLATSRLGFVRSLYAPLVASGAGVCILAFLAVLRKPANDAQRLAIGWIGAALIGTLITGHPSFHYFIPSLAALMFGIAAFAGAPRGRHVAFPRLLAASGAALLFFGTAGSALVRVREVSDAARSAQLIGACTEHAFGPGTIIYAAEYAPELYLAADALPGDRFAVVDPVLQMTQTLAAIRRPPAVFIGLADDVAPPSYRLRYAADPWRVYTAPRDALNCRIQ